MSINRYFLEVIENILYDVYRDRRGLMIYPSIDKLLVKVGSKYLLVNLVAKRVREMTVTEHYQMKENEYKSSKNIGRALEEVSKDLIHIK